MSYSLLQEHLTNHLACPDDIEKFCNLFHSKKIKKKEFLLRQGEVCLFEAFVTNGLFKLYHLDSKGDEYILYFAMQDWWLTDMGSFMYEKPSNLFIEALEDSEVLLISKKDKEFAYKHIPAIEKMFRIMTQKTHIALQHRMFDNLSKNANERYLDFITRYPEQAKRLSNIEIAKYLGVSHEFVSKIRRKIFEK